MKKWIALTLIAVLLLGGMMTVHAATTCERPCQQQECLADENKDGVCDNRGTCSGNGQGFVDADKDGVCDNRTACQPVGGCGNRGQMRSTCPMAGGRSCGKFAK